MSKTKGWLILAILAAVIGLIGVSSFVITAANAAGPSGTPTTTTTGKGPGKGHGKGHGPKATLTVTSVSGQKMSAKQQSGTSVTNITITTTSSTIYKRAGQTVSASAVTTGTVIHVRGTKNSDGSITAVQIDVVLPHVGGQLTKINGSTLTVQDKSGTHTIQTSSSTSFVNDSTHQKIALSDLKIGENIHAEGATNSNGSLSAQVVHLAPAKPAKTSTSGTPTTKGTPTAKSTEANA